jgi:regulator of cell morphogenesis and NO signaling
MQTETVATALEHEHRDIDAGIEAYLAAPSDPLPLMSAIDVLRLHIYVEEEFLFPLLRTAEPRLAAPVAVMLLEHAQIWATLDELEAELEAGSDAAVALCKELAAQLEHHNMKEEIVIYPRADDALLPETDELRSHLDSAKLPQGWVCQMG